MEFLEIDIDLSGKSILITGGSLGIGYASAEACLAAGARVLICARGANDLASAEASLAALHGADRVRRAPADVSDVRDVDRVFCEAEEHFGRIDGVIHAAGIYGPIGSIVDVDPQAWLEVIRVNLYGSFLVARAACLHMKQHGGGRIALFSGGGAANPFPNYSGYASSKVGVVRLAETVAEEMRDHDIAVNAIAPGFVATRLHDQTLASRREAGDEFYEKTRALMERGAVPASVGGRAAAFLVSDGAAAITGKFIAAPYDNWPDWPAHLEELNDGDIFTLRRIVPRDRGEDWQ